MKTRLKMFTAALFVALIIASFGQLLTALAFTLAIGMLLYPTPLTRCNMAATLSVPELLQDVLEAFKLTTPELFGPEGFGTDFSSKTAVLGDKITAHIDLLPVAANYDPTAGVGFYSGVQNAETLIADVPVTLNQFKHVPVRVKYLTQLSSKLPLYQRAIKNIGYVLGKLVVDAALAQVAGNFSSKLVINPANISLDSMEAIRSQMNIQKVMNTPRWGLGNTTFCGALQNDDRVKSDLFYNELNGNQGFRRFSNLAGFSWVREYPDINLIGNNIQFFGADPRAIAVATRRPDFSTNAIAEAMGIPTIMRFEQIEDALSGMSLTGVCWQEPGTGDLIVSAAVLFGIGAGNQGGAAGTITDNAGVVVTTQ